MPLVPQTSLRALSLLCGLPFPLLPYSLSSLQSPSRLTVCICFVLCRVPGWLWPVPSFPSQFHEQKRERSLWLQPRYDKEKRDKTLECSGRWVRRRNGREDTEGFSSTSGVPLPPPPA